MPESLYQKVPLLCFFHGLSIFLVARLAIREDGVILSVLFLKVFKQCLEKCVFLTSVQTKK